MARTAGITQEQVNLAAAELAAAGKTPGVRNVRELLGTGSNQTVQAMLQHWQKSQPAPAVGVDGPAEALPPELVQVLQAAIGGAKSAVAAEYQEALSMAHAQRDRAAQDAHDQYAEFERQQALSGELSHENVKLAAKNGELQKQVDALSASDRQRQIAEKLVAAAEAKLLLLEPLPAKVQELERAAKAAAEAHAKALNELKTAHTAELARVTEEHSRTRQALEQSAAALSQAKAEGVAMGATLKDAEGRILGLDSELTETKIARKAADDKAASAALELSNAQGRISVLQEQASQAEALRERVFKLQERAAQADTLQQQVLKLQAQLTPAEPEKTAQKPQKG